MSGYASRKEGFKGIHDPISARALVLSDGARTAAIVTWELIGIPTDVWEALSQRIAKDWQYHLKGTPAHRGDHNV